MPEESANATTPPADTPAPNAALSAATTPPARPEWLPEDYWDATAGQPLVEKLARAHTELGQRFAKGKMSFADEVRGQLEKEIVAKMREGVPEKPDGYALDVPGDVAGESLVLLAEPPGADFRPEPGKAYFVLDPKNPLLAWWRETAHKAGLSQRAFAEGIAQFARAQAMPAPTPAQIAEANARFYAELGERGQQRAAHLFGQLKAMVGDDAVMFDQFVEVGGKAAVEVLERLVEKAGGPRFNAGAAGSGAPLTAEGLRKMMDDPRYWRDRDEAYMREVTEGFRRVFGSQGRRAGTTG